MPRFIPILLLATTVFACDTTSPSYSSGEVRITTDRTFYLAGDSVHLTIANVGSVSVFYNLCPIFLERAAGVYWAPAAGAWPFGEMGCETAARWFDPGDTLALDLQLPHELATGTLRLRIPSLRDFATGEPLHPRWRVTNTFDVR